LQEDFNTSTDCGFCKLEPANVSLGEEDGFTAGKRGMGDYEGGLVIFLSDTRGYIGVKVLEGFGVVEFPGAVDDFQIEEDGDSINETAAAD